MQITKYVVDSNWKQQKASLYKRIHGAQEIRYVLRNTIHERCRIKHNLSYFKEAKRAEKTLDIIESLIMNCPREMFWTFKKLKRECHIVMLSVVTGVGVVMQHSLLINLESCWNANLVHKKCNRCTCVIKRYSVKRKMIIVPLWQEGNPYMIL